MSAPLQTSKLTSASRGTHSLQRLVRRRLTADEWDDAADLFEQGAVLAGMSEDETHSAAARKYAVERMFSLAMFATGKAMMERERMKSPNDPSSSTRHAETHK